MATQPLVDTRFYNRSVSVPRVSLNIRLDVRWDLVIVRLMVLAGFLIPALMVCDIIPASFLLVGIGFFMGAVGVIMWLIRAGEIA